MDSVKQQKRKDAFHIFYESVLKPDVELPPITLIE